MSSNEEFARLLDAFALGVGFFPKRRKVGTYWAVKRSDGKWLCGDGRWEENRRFRLTFTDRHIARATATAGVRDAKLVRITVYEVSR